MEDTVYRMLQFGQGLFFPNKAAIPPLITQTAPPSLGPPCSLHHSHFLCLSRGIFGQGILFAMDISSCPFLPPSNHTRDSVDRFKACFDVTWTAPRGH